MHFRVDLNMHEPILLGCKIPHCMPTNNQPNGFKLWVEFKYERLQEFYINCHIFYHFINDYNLYRAIRH